VKFHPPKKIKKWKWSDLKSFQLPKMKVERTKNNQISTFSFECVAKNVNEWLKLYIISSLLFFFYFDIYDIIAKFGETILWMIATSTT
jgi:hypothetical protein